MRIRKNANLSSLMFSQAEPPQTHVCQLNQSPWDVIPFSQEAFPSSLIHLQLEGEDSFNGNGSLGDAGAVESSSFHSIMEDEEEEMKNKKKAVDDNGEEKTQCCKKRDGKGWHCKNETKQGQSMCDHHLTSMKSSIISTKKPEKTQASSSGRRGQAKAAKKGTNSAGNPYEFYYYSGFGPLWGKRRGGGGIINRSAEIDGGKRNTTSYSPPSSVHQFEDLDYLEDDEDDYDDMNNDKNCDSGKKRTRKPVKARSLKSLM